MDTTSASEVPWGASESPYAHIVVCLDTQIVPVNAPTRFTYFGLLITWKYGLTASSHGSCDH